MGTMRAFKSLGGNRIGEYTILFGSERLTDSSPQRDFFTPRTDFMLAAYEKRPMLYHHALESAAKVHPSLLEDPLIGYFDKAEMDEFGIYQEGELLETHPAFTAVKAQLDKGELFPSSDSADHLVRRTKQNNGSHEVNRWPLLACSLTPVPAESRMASFGVIESAMKTLGIDIVVPTEEVKTPAAKSATLGDCIEGGMTLAALDRLVDALRYSVFFDACTGADPLTEKIQEVSDALDEFKALTLQVMQAILSGASSDTPAMAAKTLELDKLSRNARKPLSGLPQTAHSEAARETARTYVERMAGFSAMKTLDGKTLAPERVAEVEATLKVWQGGISALKTLLPTVAVDSGELAAIRRARDERHAAKI